MLREEVRMSKQGWKTYGVKWHNQHVGPSGPMKFVRGSKGGIATVRARSRDEAMSKGAKRYGVGASGLIFDAVEVEEDPHAKAE